MAFPSVPVLMYHSVGREHPAWIWEYLTISIEDFEDHIRTLDKKGFRTIDLTELFEYRSMGREIPKRSVVLTFDDGYLDNWVYVYPILKRYGMKGTIFVNPEFVDPNPVPRPNLDDVQEGRIELSGLMPFGFLSWEEMRIMENSGVIDIQSHAMSHTWYPCHDEIIDFRHPGDGYLWMDWNEDPGNKYNYLNPLWSPKIPYGQPVYAHQKSLQGKRIFPPKQLGERLVRYVEERGGIRYFESGNWKEKLMRNAVEWKSISKEKCRLETDEEFVNRLRYELKESKLLIEKELNKTVYFLCWPGGGNCDEAVKMAEGYYKAVTLPSRDGGTLRNRYGEDPRQIKRMGIPNYMTGGKIRYFRGSYLYCYLREFQGSPFYRKIRQAMKLSAYLSKGLWRDESRKLQ